jgi:signal transduction histidine kinase
VLALVTLVLFLWPGRSRVVSGFEESWGELLFLAVVILLVNFLHVDLRPMQFTLDLPLLVAVGLLYPPPLAAVVAFLGSADVREFRGRISLSRALYNRSQIALSLFLASAAYHAVASSLESWPNAILGTALATGIFAALNGLLVSTYVASGGEEAFHRTLMRLHVGRPLEFLLTYFAYGVLAYALSRLYLEVGAWSVPLFLVPIVIAHAAFVRAERLTVLASNLQKREKLLERLMDRIVDERKDERLRIASGLHDDVLQSLIRISQLGFFLEREVKVGSQAAVDVGELRRMSEETMRTLREVVGDLRQSPVGRGGLARSLGNLIKDLQFETRVRISCDAVPVSGIPGDRQLLLYQVAKEAMINALKHGEPTHLRIGLWVGGPQVILSVEDDGKGFDPSTVDESTHFGLGLMRERLRLSGGELSLESRPGMTRVEARLPLNGPSQARIESLERA